MLTQQMIDGMDETAGFPLARSTDPVTSHLAAYAAKELRKRHHGLILAALRTHGPHGKDGLAARTSLTGTQVCRRLCELERTGLVQWTGKLVKSTAGRHEREWVAV